MTGSDSGSNYQSDMHIARCLKELTQRKEDDKSQRHQDYMRSHEPGMGAKLLEQLVAAAAVELKVREWAWTVLAEYL